MISQCIWFIRNGIEYKNPDRREKHWGKEVETEGETVNESVLIDVTT